MSTPAKSKTVKAAKKVARKTAKATVRREERKAHAGGRKGKVVVVKKQSKKTLKAKPRPRGDLQMERFTSQMLNPLQLDETNSAMTPYPRQQPEEVTMFRLKYDLLLPYGSEVPTTDPRYGFGSTVMVPNMTSPLMVWENKQITEPVSFHTSILNTTGVSGLIPLTTSETDESLTSNAFEIDSTNFVNLVGPVTYDDEADSFGRVMQKSLDPQGNQFWGAPIHFLDAQSVSVTVQMNFMSYVTGLNAQCTMALVSNYGVQEDTELPIDSGESTNHTWNFAFTNAPATHGGVTGNVLPNTPLGFRIKTTSISLRPTSILVTWAQSATAPSPTYLSRYNPKYPSAARSSFDFVQEYNIVAMGELISYEGNDLQNGGSRAAMLYRGGKGPWMDGLNGFERVASALNGQERPLKVGVFQWWKPSDEGDMAFRSRSDLIKTYAMPTIVNFWQVATPTQLKSLRIRAQLVCEAKTQDMTRPVIVPTANPLGIARVMNMVQHVPVVMDNPRHWGAIGSFLKSAFGKARGAYDFYQDNKHWINPALTTLGTAVAAL